MPFPVPPEMPMRLLIIDDHPMTAAGLASLLQGHYPEADIRTSPGLPEQSGALDGCDYIFLDMHLPGLPFRQLLEHLRGQEHKIILISAFPEQDAVDMARQRGVRGLLPKNVDIARIVDGFGEIRRGADVFLDAQGHTQNMEARSHVVLTQRQQEIFAVLLDGLSNKQIARKLDISEYTVKEHVTAILNIHGARNRLELILQYRPPVV